MLAATALAVILTVPAIARVEAAAVLPVAAADSTTVVHGRTRTVAAPGVLGNDVLVGVDLLPGASFTAQLVSGPAHGTLVLDPDGGYAFHADDGYAGSDQFRYRIAGGLLGPSNTATVSISITNQAPVAVNDDYAATTGVELVIPAPGVLANDSDADGDQLTAVLVDGGGNGSLDLSGNGGFRYQSGGSFTGTRTFTYRATDGIGQSSIRTVTIAVSTSTPTPTVAPTPAPTPRPTVVPLPTLLPLPTVVPLPTPPPIGPTPRPTASGTPSPGPTTSPRPGTTASPEATPARSGAAPTTPVASSPGPSTTMVPSPTDAPAASDDPVAGAGPISPPSDPDRDGRDPSGFPVHPGGTAQRPTDPFAVPAAGPRQDGAIELDASFVAFGGFEWAVPAFVLTVPGLLLILAVVGQALIGVAWLPVTRRWVAGEQRSSRGRLGARPSR